MEVTGGNSYTEPFFDFTSYLSADVSVSTDLTRPGETVSQAATEPGYVPLMALAGYKSSISGGKIYSLYETVRIAREDAFGYCSYQYPVKFMENLSA